MDIGDIVRLLFLAFIFLSFFGGFFGRGRGQSEQEQGSAPRPTDIFESGGQDQPRRQAQPQQRPQERQMPTTASEWWEELTGQRSQQEQPQQPREPERQIVTYDDALEQPTAESQRAQQSQQRRRDRQERESTAAGTSVREAERAITERDLTDMPAPMDVFPRRTRMPEVGSSVQRRSTRSRSGGGGTTGGDVLRRSLRNPDSLERAFILKEVLDEPLGLRKDQHTG